MPEPIRKILEIPAGYLSQAVARYVWQLDDQTRRLIEATAGLTPEALAWQPAPGCNTMGMLLTHIAVSEAHMTAVLLEGRERSDVPGLLGLEVDDDGLPLPPDGLPPAALAGKDIAYFHGLMRRAREETRRVAAGLSDADLDRRIVRQPGDGTTRHYNVDWSLFHIAEHLAGHHAQILQLKHLHARLAGA
jgi:uncharacterized damage-inducible protein DinB